MRTTTLLVLSLVPVHVYSMSEQEWQCRRWMARYDQIDRELQRDYSAECMARPGNPDPALRSIICGGEVAGKLMGRIGLQHERDQLDQTIRAECLSR